MEMSPVSNGAGTGHASVSPQPEPKNVRFELVSAESPQYRARLPMRVSIFPHDATESIVTTVKNFYGLYSSPTSSKGVSFEDQQGNTLIARYENFRNNMVVYVRVIEEPTGSPGSFGAHSCHHSAPAGGQPFFSPEVCGQTSAAQHSHNYLDAHVSRPASGASRRRSPSPGGGRGRRSTSVGTNTSIAKKSRSRSGKTHGDGCCNDSVNGYSSGDGAPGSSSGKSKDQIGNTEISVENILEGGRRKRAKFESSELPLFAPPQMPATTSNPSVSPARRIEHHRASLPFVHPGQNPFTNPRPLQSPQSNGHIFSHPGAFVTPGPDNRRTRSIGYPSGLGIGGIGVGQPVGILPTPDPTVGSCMSEEDKDVAMQLMRLGDISNVSHGRTSASTLDDTFSGRADAASSTGATSAEDESEEELSPARRQKVDGNGSGRKVYPTTEAHLVPPQESTEEARDLEEGLEEGLMGAPKTKPINNSGALFNGPKHPKPQGGSTMKPKAPKAAKLTNGAAKSKKPVAAGMACGPMSPASLPASRKQSVASSGSGPHLGGMGDDDHPDLSSKPRCQRCRKSKKGCDRQRPCGRCRDAGLPIEMCISEDEGNGRKGRYGRHMGVPIVKKEFASHTSAPIQPPTLLPAAPIAPSMPEPFAAGFPLDKSKKRKR